MRRIIVLQELELPHIGENITTLCIDIGLSYDAPHSKHWLSLHPDVFVFGFEPVPENCKNVLETIKDDRFHLYQCAVSNKNEKKKFNITKHDATIEKDRGQSSFYKPATGAPFKVEEEIEVDCISLNSFLLLIDWDKFKEITILKIDTQGHDSIIIQDIKPYFDKLPRIKLEVSTRGEYEDTPDTSPQEIKKFMEENGYHLVHDLCEDHYYERR